MQVLHSLRNLGDCDGEGLRSHVSDNAKRPIAEMPGIDGDGFCLAALLAVSQITLGRSVASLAGFI